MSSPQRAHPLGPGARAAQTALPPHPCAAGPVSRVSLLCCQPPHAMQLQPTRSPLARGHVRSCMRYQLELLRTRTPQTTTSLSHTATFPTKPRPSWRFFFAADAAGTAPLVPAEALTSRVCEGGKQRAFAGPVPGASAGSRVDPRRCRALADLLSEDWRAERSCQTSGSSRLARSLCGTCRVACRGKDGMTTRSRRGTSAS
jgi:hypothetical protein